MHTIIQRKDSHAVSIERLAGELEQKLSEDDKPEKVMKHCGNVVVQPCLIVT